MCGMRAVLAVVLVCAWLCGASGQGSITVNPTIRSTWAITPHFSSVGIEYLNHEVRVLCWTACDTCQDHAHFRSMAGCMRK